MRIVVTGGTGFVGSHLVRALVRDGHVVVLMKRLRSDVSRVADLFGRLEVCEIEQSGEESPFQSGRVDAVIHLATAYGRAGESDLEIEEANIRFPSRLLEYSRSSGVSLFINTDTFSTKAAEPVRGLERYVSSKKAFRRVGSQRSAELGTRFVTLQLEHVYGPLDGETKFVPSVIRAFLAGESHYNFTPAAQRRDFVYVEDVVSAFLVVVNRLDQTPNPPDSFEVGTGVTHTLSELVNLVHELTSTSTLPCFGALPYNENEMMYSVADLSPLQALGWVPQVSLRAGLLRTVDSERQRVLASQARLPD